MTIEELAKRVLLVKPTPESLGEVAEMLLKETCSGGPEAAAEEISSYMSTVNDLIFSWMAEGKHDDLQKVAMVFRNTLDTAAKVPRLLSSLSSHDQLTIRLDILIRHIAQLLRGDSLAKYIGLLSGKRREAWRNLLLGMYGHGQGDGAPVRRSEAHQFCTTAMSPEAGEKAVDKMAELGLLTKSEAGPKNVQFQLTWAGRRVAQACLELQEDDKPEPAQFSLETLRGERMLANPAEVGLTEFEPDEVAAINGYDS
jgi:hypothetical protein